MDTATAIILGYPDLETGIAKLVSHENIICIFINTLDNDLDVSIYI